MSDRELIKKHLLPLLTLSGVSGREGAVIRYMVEAMKPLVDEIRVDPMGNIFTVKRGKPGPKVMIAAHSDEIGLIVKSIEKNGFIRFEKMGGVGDNLLPGRVVSLAGHIGVIGVKAGHLSSEKERSEVKKHTELYIDVGARSQEEVLSMGIMVGTPITFVSPPTFMSEDLLVSKALDDRVGCAVMLALLESLKDREFRGELHCVITVQEEIGLRGATVAAFEVNPDIAIALDTVPSGDTPEINFTKELPVGIGLGPVLQVTSGGGARGMVADTTVFSMLEKTAKEAGLPYQPVLFTGGNTDATAMHLSRSGIPSAAVTIPRRYSHSPVELIDLRDADAALRLLREFVIRLPEKIEWMLPGDRECRGL
ncbi:MAG TPA: M42 family metallopeptidase [Firmicutes bacterium]|nr:M42 family metallopeptidase [Candidatus Fermentithermobacillaceae bacterium]